MREWRHRHKQVGILKAFYGSIASCPFALVVHGPSKAGKTSIVQSVLKDVRRATVIVDAVQCFNLSLLFRRVLLGVKVLNDSVELLQKPPLTEQLASFAVHLQYAIKGIEDQVVIVFDNAHELRKLGHGVYSTLLRLPEQVGPNLSFIFIDAYPMLVHESIASLIHVEFEQYTEKQLLDIVSEDVPQVAQHIPKLDNIYSRFLRIVSSTLGQVTEMHIGELRQLSRALWKDFISPVTTGEIPALEVTFEKLYARQKALFASDEVIRKRYLLHHKQDHMSYASELPLYSRYLLLAAFLASYNNSSLDSHLSKHTDGRTKKRRKVGGGGSGNRRVEGPKAFILERMIAIFHAISPHEYKSDILTHIATLASLKLMVRVAASTTSLEGGGRWKVNIGHEYAHQLAHQCHFELDNYML